MSMDKKGTAETIRHIPESYVARDGCHNCRHVFVLEEYEEPDYLFCTRGAPPRPRCGSVFMGQGFFVDLRSTDKKALEAIKEWARWSDGRWVDSCGKCDKWEEAK